MALPFVNMSKKPLVKMVLIKKLWSIWSFLQTAFYTTSDAVTEIVPAGPGGFSPAGVELAAGESEVAFGEEGDDAAAVGGELGARGGGDVGLGAAEFLGGEGEDLSPRALLGGDFAGVAEGAEHLDGLAQKRVDLGEAGGGLVQGFRFKVQSWPGREDDAAEEGIGVGDHG